MTIGKTGLVTSLTPLRVAKSTTVSKMIELYGLRTEG